LIFKVLIERKALKQIESLTKDTRPRVTEALQELENGFSSRLDIKKLKGTKNHYRVRVGEYRVLFMLDAQVIYVYDISHRGNVYG